MTYKTELTEGILVIRMSGDLLGTADENDIFITIQKHIEAGQVHCATQISDINYMNSTGLSVLIRMLTKFRNSGGEMFLVKPSQQAEKLLLITKLNSIFSVADTVENAISELKAKI